MSDFYQEYPECSGFKPTHEDFYLYFGTGSSGQKVLSLKKTKQYKEEELKSNYYWG